MVVYSHHNKAILLPISLGEKATCYAMRKLAS